MKVGSNLRKRADGRYEARYEKGRDANGAIIYGFCYGKTWSEAEWKRRDAMVLWQNANSSNVTFEDIASEFLNANEANKVFVGAFDDPSTASLHMRLRELTALHILSCLQTCKKSHSAEAVEYLYNALKSYLSYAVDEGYICVSPMEHSDMLDKYITRIRLKVGKTTVAPDISHLTEKQYRKLLHILYSDPNERKFGILLSVEMGLSFSEIAALRVSDVDWDGRLLTVNKKTAGRSDVLPCPERSLPMPQTVLDYFGHIARLYKKADSVLLKKGNTPISERQLNGFLAKLNNDEDAEIGYDGEVLRNTFAVRRLQAGVNLVDLSAYMGESVAEIARRYAGAVHGNVAAVLAEDDNEPMVKGAAKGMDGKFNLLILGAGDYGHTVKEIAERIGVFDLIAFLDDDNNKSEAIGPCTDYEGLKNQFNAAFPAFGNNELRKEYTEKLQEAGYIIPKLIHPDATISPSCTIENGVIIEAKATVNAGALIKKGSLICSASLVDKGATVESYCHIDSMATVIKDSIVAPLTHVECGTIYRK